jgi:hypothetical protein
MEREQPREEEQPQEPEEQRESGMPGGGAGRRDEPGKSGVYPASQAEGASPDAPLRGQAEWGQGERGAAGSEDSGSSELNFEQERQLGLLSEESEGFTAEQSEG